MIFVLSRSGELVPIHEARGAVAVQELAKPATRLGFEPDVPRGGTNVRNQGGDYPTGDRASFMREAYGAYIACPWISAPIDVTARTVTAGGIVVEPDDTVDQADIKIDEAPPQVQKLAKLIKWVNPSEGMVQLLRGVSSDLDIYGDSFTEVVWLLGEPVALYSLDSASMSVAADEHGNVTGYWQTIDTLADSVWFETYQVIHISEDNPRGKLYGTSFVQKAFWACTTYLFAAGLLKERMRKGDPPDVHIDAPLEQQDNELRAWTQQYKIKNVGAANIGNPVVTKGGFQISELRSSSREDLVAIMTSQRDIMVSLSGTPPNQVGIIESGNLGGGTGTSQWRSYQLNRVQPRAALIMEQFNFSLCTAFGVEGWQLAFSAIDYRDDPVLDQIRDARLKSGLWSLNEARADVNLPAVDGGDDHIMVERAWVQDWAHMTDFAQSWIVKNGGTILPTTAPGPAVPVPGDEPIDNPDPAAAGNGSAETWLTRVASHYAAQLAEAEGDR